VRASPCRVKISDGEHFGIGMLTSGMAQQVLTEALRPNAFVKLKNYMVNQLQNSKCGRNRHANSHSAPDSHAPDSHARVPC
jgi:hypothetical protein